LDETSPQTTANTQRLWSFGKPEIFKNTTKMKANTFRFYPLTGKSVLDFKDHSKKEDMCEFLQSIKENNPNREITLILDNFSSHHAAKTKETASNLSIRLVFLPPYSPDLNPIESIWKSIKKVISREFIKDVDHLKFIIKRNFEVFSSRLSFARKWIKKFLGNNFNLLGS
jgi:transposase